MERNIFEEIKQFFLKGSVVSRLMLINIGIFLFINLVNLFMFLFAIPASQLPLANWLGVSSNLAVLAQRPWGILTYMFVHESFFHIFFNMLMLYVGGRLFTSYLGANRLTATYLIGGLAGALFFILAYNIFPAFEADKFGAFAIGASASVLAIFVAIAVYMPNFKLPLLLLGPIRLKYIALAFIVIDLLSIQKGNAGGHIAHLGGALWGYLYIVFLKNGSDVSIWVNKILAAFGGLFKSKPKLKVDYRNQRPLNDDDYNAMKAENQKKIDAILDKISKNGYASLSSQEKELLFRMGNKK